MVASLGGPRPAGALLLLLLATIGSPFWGPTPGVGAAPTITLRGRVFTADSMAPLPGQAVSLISTDARGATNSRTKDITDERGRFSFEAPGGASLLSYLVVVPYRGGLFGARVSQAELRTRDVVREDVRVWPTTRDPHSVAVVEEELFAVVRSENLEVLESVTVGNDGDRAYIGRAAGRQKRGASFVFGLPRGAADSNVELVESDLLRFAPNDLGLAVLSAIPPGESTTVLKYEIPIEKSSFDLSRVALYGTKALSIAAPPAFEAVGAGWEDRGLIEVSGRRLRRWTTSSIEAGDQIQLVLRRAPLPTGPWPAIATTLWIPFVAVLLLVPIARLRRARRSNATRRALTHEELVLRIAELDISHEEGEISSAEWADERRRLKQQLLDSAGDFLVDEK